MRPHRLSGLLGLFSVLSVSACGQKGPPLAPIVYLPRAASEVVAKRIENDIVLQFTVPSVNTDGSGPADLRKIEVYAHTGPLPAPTDFLKFGTLVASVDIKQPPESDETDETDAGGAKSAGGAVDSAGAPDVDAAPDVTSASGLPAGAQSAKTDPALPKQDAEAAAKASLVEQGAKTFVRETLTPKHMAIGPMPPVRPVPPSTDTPVVLERLETSGTVNFELPLQRYYTVVGVSESRNRRGPFAGPFPVALMDPSMPPQQVDIAYTAESVSLSWSSQPEDVAIPATPAAGAKSAAGATAAGPPLDRETEGTHEFFADVETEGTQDVLAAFTPPPGSKTKPTPPLPAPPPLKPRFGYNVYETGAVGATGATGATDAKGAIDAASAPTAAIAPPAPIAPLNATLLTTPTFADPRVEFGVERCYVVRRVEMAGTVAIESAPSTPACVTPVDTFPPAPPKSLAHIAGGNGVSLLWEANTESDLGGYLVLRGEAPDDKLSLLTPTPITDTSFLDTTTRRGRTYFYEVVAVDRSTPPNQSAPSERVEETIR